jgi:large-conductance mechanosensitive channel
MVFISRLKQFLDRTNAMTLVLGVMAGAAVNRAFIAFLDDIFNPFLSHACGLHDWRSAELVLSQTADATGQTSLNVMKFGHFGGILLDLSITVVVVLVAARWFRKESQQHSSKSSGVCANCATAVSTAQRHIANQLDFSPAKEIEACAQSTHKSLPVENRLA